MALLPRPANTEGNNETLGDRTPMPAGDYLAHVIKSEWKATKAKTGHYMAMTLAVIDGPHKGRQLFVNLNLDNPNPIAVEIANKEFNTICQAVGKVGVEDTVEIHNMPMCITVKITKQANSDYPPSNEIVGYKDAVKYTGEFDEAYAKTPEEVAADEPTEKPADKKPAKAVPPWAKK